MSKIKVALVGRHANRTPMAYPVYRDLFQNYCDFTDKIENADVAVLGYSVDLNGVCKAKKSKNKNIKYIVISEEPLWDTLSPNDFRLSQDLWSSNGHEIHFSNINYYNSNVFDFLKIPYFLTTDSVYISRYAQILTETLSRFSPEATRLGWQHAKYKLGFFLQKRNQSVYEFKDEKNEVFGLSCYRTELAQLCQSQKTLIRGKDWKDSVQRQSIPDWHLDKLSKCSGDVGAMSAIENTHMHNYLSEKLFDAFSVGAVPIYYASPFHRVFEFAYENSFLNLYGMSPHTASEYLENLDLTKTDLEAYEASLVRLRELFCSPTHLQMERSRVVWNTMKAIEKLVNT